MELGKVEVMLKRPQDAVEPLRRSIALDPDLFQAHFVLGTALRQLGRTQEANAEQRIAEKIQAEHREQDIKDVSGPQ
jgi:Flp pilus assembly protein TadD